jgi:hypothetical protein
MSNASKRSDSETTTARLSELGCEVKVEKMKDGDRNRFEVVVTIPKGWEATKTRSTIKVVDEVGEHKFSVTSDKEGHAFVYFDDRPDQAPQPVRSGSAASGRVAPKWRQ